VIDNYYHFPGTTIVFTKSQRLAIEALAASYLKLDLLFSEGSNMLA